MEMIKDLVKELHFIVEVCSDEFTFFLGRSNDGSAVFPRSTCF